MKQSYSRQLLFPIPLNNSVQKDEEQEEFIKITHNDISTFAKNIRLL